MKVETRDPKPSLIRPPLPWPPTTQFVTKIEKSNKGPSLQDLLGYFLKSPLMTHHCCPPLLPFH